MEDIFASERSGRPQLDFKPVSVLYVDTFGTTTAIFSPIDAGLTGK